MSESMLSYNGETFVVVDVETTGLSPAYGDRVCEVGIVRARDDEILDTYQTLVNPQRPISPGASRVNGLRDEDVCEAPIFAEIAGEVLRRIDGAVLVCHNAPFDLGFLDAELSRLDLPWAPSEVFDETPQAHRALGDALTTFQVFRHFRRQLARQDRDFSGSYRPMQAQVQAAILPPEIQEALDDEQELLITYIDAKGDETTRLITPRRVIAMNGYVYMVAYCHMRQAERQFRLDRIVKIEP
jgi:DNA polymerase III epsilon subunit-like protein